MGKTLSCKDVSLNCDTVIQGETEEEVMEKAAEHAAEKHGVTEFSAETRQKMRSLIKDE